MSKVLDLHGEDWTLTIWRLEEHEGKDAGKFYFESFGEPALSAEQVMEIAGAVRIACSNDLSNAVKKARGSDESPTPKTGFA